MRVFYDHQVTSLQDAGGASRYHYELLRHVAGVPGISAMALLGGNRSTLPYRELRSVNLRISAWNTPVPPGYLRYGVNEAISAALAPGQGGFDIYHASYYRALPYVRRRSLVVTHHDCVQERFPELFRNAASIMRAKRRLFAQADRILCVSAASRADLHRFYRVEEDRTEVIHHGFARLGLGERESVPLPPGSSPGEPYLLYVGSRAPYKNFGLLLRAFAESGLDRQFRLLAAGGGPPSDAERGQIASLRLSGRVDFAGQVSEAALGALYRGAALFVYPSLYEGFGFPPLEAMSEGCPALVSNTSAMPEVCGDAAFYFDPSGWEHMAEALLRLMADPELLRSKRERGLAHVQRFSWATTTAATLDAYRRTVARGR